MNRNVFLILLLLLSITGKVAAQVVTVEAQIDSLQISIGEQAKIQLQVSMDSQQHASFPLFTDTLVRGVELVEVSKVDTQYLNNKQRLLLTQEYTITSFDEALYYIPPLSVIVDNKEYKSKELALKVYSVSVPADTLNPEQFFGQKPIMEAPFMWEDVGRVIGLLLLSIPLLTLLIYLVIRLSDNQPIIRRVKVEPKLPPHILAMKYIEKVKEEKTWQNNQPKEYYTELTDIIRTYIKDRFGFNALEMTSSEIIGKLMEVKGKDNLNELKSLFQTADLVKFAKHNPLINENDANLIHAIEFINETKEVEEENQKPQPTEITIIEKRSLRTKIILICGILALTLSLVMIVVYVITQRESIISLIVHLYKRLIELKNGIC
jgi:hypothetical protein